MSFDQIKYQIAVDMALDQIMRMYTPPLIANLSMEMDKVYRIRQAVVEELQITMKKFGNDRNKFQHFIATKTQQLEKDQKLAKDDQKKRDIEIQLEIYHKISAIKSH